MARKAAPHVTKVLVANRGEIACRVIAACRALGIKAVAVYSEADAKARHVRLADEAVAIGPGPAAESYLNTGRILEACRKTGADAVHPGYGFMSERAEFAAAVVEAGLTWIGPPAAVIDLMGNKIAAKRAAEESKVPTLPWALLEAGWKPKDLDKAAERVGYPLLLKAAAGGGGRGMRLVEKAAELHEKAESAAREAQGAFGSAEIFLEKYCGESRHIEVQVFADTHGNTVALGERECSVQRRHQKVIEEAPAPNLSDKTRRALCESAVALARSVGYVNAGTCEFLVDGGEKHYFLEMNTRLQVEHPVTELVWGVDLPVMQLRAARGESLRDELAALTPRGHAIEARLYAEDPAKGFMPSPGTLELFSTPILPQLRIDAGYETGGEVPLYYDAMLAKVVAWGMDREQARHTLLAGLAATKVVGVAWNGAYLSDILAHKTFIAGKVTTQFLGKEFTAWKGETRSTVPVDGPSATAVAAREEAPSAWQAFGAGGGKVGGSGKSAASRHAGDAQHDFIFGGPLIAEYPGKVLKVLVKNGQSVTKGQVVVVCESMKMEFSYSAPFETKVRSVGVTSGMVITAGTVLVEWEDEVEGS